MSMHNLPTKTLDQTTMVILLMLFYGVETNRTLAAITGLTMATISYRVYALQELKLVSIDDGKYSGKFALTETGSKVVSQTLLDMNINFLSSIKNSDLGIINPNLKYLDTIKKTN